LRCLRVRRAFTPLRPGVRFAVAAAVTAFMVSPRAARAQGWFPASGNVEPIAAEVLLSHDGRTEALVEQVYVMSTARAAVWLRAFPSTPQLTQIGDTPLFQNLDALTSVEEPYNETMRPRLFGPSVVTLLTRKLSQANEHPQKRVSAMPEADRTLEVQRLVFFSGHVESSTITHRPFLPGEMIAFFRSEGVQPSPAAESLVASTMNRGWTVLGLAIRDRRPSSEAAARIGPLQLEFVSPSVIYPQDLEQTPGAAPGAKTLRLYLATPRVLAPNAYETVWDDRPWEHSAVPLGRFVVTYNRAIETGPAEFEINERTGIKVAPEWHLVRTELQTPASDHRDVELVPAARAVALPPTTKKGSGTDLFLCLLLGLTPLLYTPESWFLLWLGARARSKARATRRERPVFGVKLWSFYAVLVGAFWLLGLEGGARVAAIVPALIGIVQLALPYTERDPSPYRAQIRKKKK
jgi:hypothetical protein